MRGGANRFTKWTSLTICILFLWGFTRMAIEFKRTNKARTDNVGNTDILQQNAFEGTANWTAPEKENILYFQKETKEDLLSWVSKSNQKPLGNISEYTFYEKVTSTNAQAKVIGVKRSHPGYMTIGVPTIKRINGMEYLLRTLWSLISQTTDSQKSEIVVVVFVAEFDIQFQEEVVNSLTTAFPDYIRSGFLRILRIDRKYYPALTGLKRNYGDSETRVKWRSKQNVDFAYMFLYGIPLSQYYLQLEDDVMAASDFVSAIKTFVQLQKQWASLDFSSLGFIGKFFKSSDLQKLGQFFLTFFDEQPVDWLIRYWRMSMTQNEVIMRKPTLFQHFGLHSSLQDISKQKKSNDNTKGLNTLKDKYFMKVAVNSDFLNPPAVIETNMEIHESHSAEKLYRTDNYMWAKDVKEGQHLTVIFQQEHKLDKMFITTGSEAKPDDILSGGSIEVSPLNDTRENLTTSSSANISLTSAYSDKYCHNFTKIAETGPKGRLELKNMTAIVPYEVKCVRLKALKPQENWLIIDQFLIEYIPKRKSPTKHSSNSN